MQILKIAGAVLLLSAPLYAQDEAARKQAAELMARVPLETAVKGAPYSAETIVDASQTLADGNRIVRKTTGRVYRDGDGRVRREEDRQDGTVGISITDPVAGVAYSLDSVNKTAWKTPLSTAGLLMGKLEAAQTEAMRKRDAEKAAPVNDGRAITTVEPGGAVTMRGEAYRTADAPLEHRTIEGLAVQGHKTTATIPAGKVGNEQPITITSEEWSSPELKVLVLTRHADPRMGESSYRLTNIVRAEPDRSLFIVPSDYTLKETGIRRMADAKRQQ